MPSAACPSRHLPSASCPDLADRGRPGLALRIRFHDEPQTRVRLSKPPKLLKSVCSRMTVFMLPLASRTLTGRVKPDVKANPKRGGDLPAPPRRPLAARQTVPVPAGSVGPPLPAPRSPTAVSLKRRATSGVLPEKPRPADEGRRGRQVPRHRPLVGHSSRPGTPGLGRGNRSCARSGLSVTE